MSETADLAVIGAGPAGLAAATVAADHGLSVILLDEQPAPGGQIYRNIENFDKAALEENLGEDYTKGRAIAEAFRASTRTTVRGPRSGASMPTAVSRGQMAQPREF